MAVIFPTQNKKTKYIKSYIIFITLPIHCNCTLSVFQLFYVKHLLTKTYFQNNFLVLQHLCVDIRWYYSCLRCLHLENYLDLWAGTCSSVICIIIISFVAVAVSFPCILNKIKFWTKISSSWKIFHKMRKRCLNENGLMYSQTNYGGNAITSFLYSKQRDNKLKLGSSKSLCKIF